MNLRKLQSYSITKEFCDKFLEEERTNKRENSRLTQQHSKAKENIQEPAKSNTKSNPKCREISYNSLFWAFYSLLNEQEVMLEHNKFKLKNAFTMGFVEKIKNEKPFLKQNKLKFHDIESSLLYDKDISLSTLKCLVLYNRMNLVYVWNNKYYIFESNDDDNFYYLQRNREKYITDRELKKEHILANKVAGKLLMEDTRTELKSLGTYKMNDLQEMANTLNISIVNESKRKTKQQLYEEINIKID
jgi:hypothetical protein